MKGPGIFFAQFMGDRPPFDSFDRICAWASSLGYVGAQLPSWDQRCMDLGKAADSKAYCDDLRATAARHGVTISEVSTHLQGQLVAVHPAYGSMFQAFAPSGVTTPAQMQQWGTEQAKLALRASRNLGCTAMPTFSGALLWHTFYPWPQRPAGLVEEGFAELARRWLPILDYAEEMGVDCAFEVHPGEDLFDGATVERFLADVKGHARAQLLYDPSHFMLQQLDYLEYLDLFHDRIKVFHVKDAEFRPSGRCGTYGGYLGWVERAGRFRSLGDGQIDFTGIFSKLAQYDYPGWAVVEWECALKDNEQGAKEGAEFVKRMIIQTAKKSFDDFAASGADAKKNQRLLGIAKGA